MNNEPLPYNPVVLKWARESANYTISEIAIKFKKDPVIISSWENGTASPIYVQLERLAYEFYHRPLAIFFFPEPPEEISKKESFRTLPKYEFEQMSPQFMYLLRKAQARQEDLKELNDDINPAKEKLIKNFFIDAQDSVEDTAENFRKYLNITIETQQSWKNTDNAFKYWRSLLEEYGIYIFKDAFKDDSFSGFCIYDDKFPLIYINNSKPKTRQIFTLFHELAHILFKTGGVDTRLDDYIDYLDDESKMIEIYCNKFAASFLVPINNFKNDIEGREFNENTLSELAILYSVSREVILRKLLDMGRVDRSYYLEKSNEWIEQAKETKSKKKNEKDRGTFYNTRKAYLGKNFLNLVFDKFYQEKISTNQVADYLDIKINQITEFETSYLKGSNI